MRDERGGDGVGVEAGLQGGAGEVHWADAGVVDEDVEVAVLGLDLLHGGGDGGVRGDVQLEEGDGAGGRRGLDGGQGLFALFQRPAGEDRVVVGLLREELARREADAVVAAGDEDDGFAGGGHGFLVFWGSAWMRMEERGVDSILMFCSTFGLAVLAYSGRS